jgi:prepilin-type N-terminal cleavage/methylation domain-containing protein
MPLQLTEAPPDRGFTLVEILIVIVVLGVVATITLVSVRGITDRGEL